MTVPSEELPADLRDIVEALVDVHCARWEVRLRIHSRDHVEAGHARRELEKLEGLRSELILAVDALVDHDDLPPVSPHG